MEMQGKKPKVSVCVVTYNQEKYIGQCLQSIVDQKTDFDFEVIVGDDASTDKTSEIVRKFCEKYANIFKVVIHEKNIGPTKNYLSVHNLAQGKYVAHIDGDDYALPGKLQAQSNNLDADSKRTVVWHRVDYFDDSGGFCSGKTADISVFNNGQVSFAEAIRMGFIGVHSSLMYRRSVRERNLFSHELLDIYFTWDFLSKGSGYVLDEVLGRYRVSSSGSVSVSSSRKICLLAIEHAYYFLNKFPEQRKNFFIWAFTNAIVDFKNLRPTFLNFLLLAVRSFSIVSLRIIFINMTNIKKIRVRWNQKIALD